MGSNSNVPTRAIGTISTCARIARKNAPGMKGLMSPSGVRPPSGKITSGIPDRRLFTADLMLPTDDVGFCWLMQTCPERVRCHPTCLLYTSDAADERSSVDLG